MDFIQFEAIDESQQNEINFSDNDDDEKTEQNENFIDDSEQPMEDESFSRTFDPENIDQYNKFSNQTRSPKDAEKVDCKSNLTQDWSSSIIQKFNGYEIIKHELARKEKIEFTPINIIYEPVYDENVPVHVISQIKFTLHIEAI